MSEQSTAAPEAATTEQQNVLPNPFSESSWQLNQDSVNTEPAPEIKNGSESGESAQTEPANTTSSTSEDTDVVDLDEYIKRELGLNDFGSLKSEFEELRKLKESATTKEELKFANEQSQKFFEYLKEGKEDDVFSHLEQKRKLSKVAEMSAIDALKLKIELENRHYTKEDIQDEIEDRYSFPEKPIQDIESDEEYQEKVNQWQQRVDKIKRRIERDAIVAKEDLAKRHQELVLPDIPTQKKETANNEPTPEELAKAEEIRKSFLSKLDADYKNYNGYQTTYKDEEVEIPVSFGLSDEEKLALRNEVEGFNVENFIMSRWFDETGQPKITQMMDDINLLNRKEDIIQKMVKEVGAKMKEHYIKTVSNITVNGTQQAPKHIDSAEAAMQAQIEHIWNTK